jgi:hypothetical protein
MGKRIDITGQSFGMLKVNKFFGINKHGEVIWNCGCSCGGEINTLGYRLRNGHTKSCGCLKKNSLGDRSRTHGMSKTPEFIMYYDACKRAIKRNLPIDIVPQDILIPKYCPVLGLELKSGDGIRSPNTASLDCIDPSLGYVKGNIQVVCWRYNKFKADLTPQELKLIAKWILK